MYHIGIDIGSTTAKLVLIKDSEIIEKMYERHFSRVREKCCEMLRRILPIVGSEEFYVSISGSAGLGLSREIGVSFVQEVYAEGEIIKEIAPDTSAVIELGGEDAKIIFYDGTAADERMNGSCAGGTGAFIDQMATLLNISVTELDNLSLKAERYYPIASRCGVFAKTDIQPLLNQGAQKEDIALSIYRAVVNQTIAGLAQGRKIDGKVLFLGGPLYFCKGLRKCFKDILNLDEKDAVFPDWGRFAVALGAAIYSKRTERLYTVTKLIELIENAKPDNTKNRLPALFENESEYNDFIARHEKATVPKKDISEYRGGAYLGIDCGSTTTKLVLIGENKELLYSFYSSNKGNPVEIIKDRLAEIYALTDGRIEILGSAVTGYGEELIKHAFSVDFGLVETIAHYTAAKYFKPDVDFIIDIGGQDIKCFKIRNGAIDSIMLNEACSSGCGSFLETFAVSMGYSIKDFAKKGLLGKNPVNLGSRCTVFMNSSVKQSQKDGATIEDISAGLSISVIKNALYKVIRASSPDELGKNIVVQGGTFYNDAVLRAFENEIGRNVVRPSIAGLMGAYGAAIYSMRAKKSTLIKKDELSHFTHTSKATRCNGCTNHCRLTVNIFSGGKKFISGNQCDRGAGIKKSEPLPNLYEFKRNYLTSLCKNDNIDDNYNRNGNTNNNISKISKNTNQNAANSAAVCENSLKKSQRGTLGLPLALGMYELLPLWHGIFKSLGFNVLVSEMSSRSTYERGQFSIPSDTACYPAKIMHGHIMYLLDNKADYIFYPCLSYNVNEGQSDNHYNCPVVAYYSELLSGNIEELNDKNFFYPYLNINSKRQLSKELFEFLNKKIGGFSHREVSRAVKLGFSEYDKYTKAIRSEGENALKEARAKHKRIMILSGRPYHIDSEIGHGIDKLANSLGFAVLSEDSICHLAKAPDVKVLNQWTYHARLYRAASYAAAHRDCELVQLVSFGCGIDAITTDEVRSILEEHQKYYTQLKIDEITNLGAVKIRLRSLLGALSERDGEENDQ